MTKGQAGEEIARWLERAPSEGAWWSLCRAVERAKGQVGWEEVDAALTAKGWPEGLRQVPARWLERALGGESLSWLRLCRSLAVSGEATEPASLQRALRLEGLQDICALTITFAEGDESWARAVGKIQELSRMRFLGLMENELSWKGLQALLSGGHLGQIAELTLHEGVGVKGAEALAKASLPSIHVLGLRGAGLDEAACRALAKAPWLGQIARLDISQNPMGDQGVMALFSGAWSSLSVLWMEEVSCRARGLGAMMQGLRKQGVLLEEAALGSNPLGRLGFQSLAEEGAGSLRVLRVGDCGGEGGGLKALASSAWPQLESLDLSENRLSSKEMASFSLLSAPQLRELDLSGNRFGVVGCGHLAAWCGEGEISELRLDGCEIEDEGALALASASLPALRRLGLQGCEIGEKGAVALAGAPWWQGLSLVEVGFNPLGEAGAGALLSGEGEKAWVSLSLAGLGMQGQAIQSLVHARMPKLIELSLAGSALTERDLEAIAQASWSRQLEQLDLSSTGFSDAMAMQIEHLGAFARLNQLFLGEHELSAKGIQAIARSPSLASLHLLDLGERPLANKAQEAIFSLLQRGCEVLCAEVDITE